LLHKPVATEYNISHHGRVETPATVVVKGVGLDKKPEPI